MSPVEIDDYVLDTLMADLVGHDRDHGDEAQDQSVFRQTLTLFAVSRRVTASPIASLEHDRLQDKCVQKADVGRP